MKAASLAIVHQYFLAYRQKTIAQKQELLLARREIDFNSSLALFFGPEASISAQGVSSIDLELSNPILKVEIKYLRRNKTTTQPVNKHTGVMKDWNWLLRRSSQGFEFKQCSWVVFLPSKDIFDFHSNFQVPQGGANGPPAVSSYAPFLGLVRPDPIAQTQLAYRSGTFPREAILRRTNPAARVYREVVGNPSHPVWCLIFSRMGTNAVAALDHLTPYDF
jgi:hypothetical protein